MFMLNMRMLREMLSLDEQLIITELSIVILVIKSLGWISPKLDIKIIEFFHMLKENK